MLQTRVYIETDAWFLFSPDLLPPPSDRGQLLGELLAGEDPGRGRDSGQSGPWHHMLSRKAH